MISFFDKGFHSVNFAGFRSSQRILDLERMVNLRVDEN